MSGRKPKKNQRLGSSRRGTRGLRVNEEKGDEHEDEQNEFRTTTDIQSDVTDSHGQSDHLPSLSVDHQTPGLEGSPHAGSLSHKDSDVEAELPDRKRKIGSTRKRAGGLKLDRKLEPCDEVITTEELGEERVAQPNTSAVEEKQMSAREDEQRSHEQASLGNFPSNLSQQTWGSGLEGELGASQNIVVMLSQNKEHDAVHHQEITSYNPSTGLASYEVESNIASDVAMGQSAHSTVVTATESNLFSQEESKNLDQPNPLSRQETPLASTSRMKRKMGSTRRPLGEYRENVDDVQELSRSMREDVWKAEVIASGESEFNMLEEMLQTWDDVKGKDSPTNTSSLTDSGFVSNQSLSSEQVEEPDVPVGTENNNQSVARSVLDTTKPLPETSSHHKTPLLTIEPVTEKTSSDTNHQTEDFNVFQIVTITASPPTHSDNHTLNTDLEEVGNVLDTFQNITDTRNDTNTLKDSRSEELVELKEEPSRNDPMIISTSKQDVQLDELLSYDEGSPASPCLADSTTNDNCESSTDVHIEGGFRVSDMLESDISHAESTAPDYKPEMSSAAPDIHSVRGKDEENKTLMESSTSEQSENTGSTQSKDIEHKDENVNRHATERGIEIHSEVEQGKTRPGVEEHSANETNVSDSSLCSANCNLANLSPVTAHLHNSDSNLNSPVPEDSKLSYDVMDEIVVCSQLNNPTINNNESAASFPKAETVAENQDIYMGAKEEKDIYAAAETSLTCDVTVTDVMDLADVTEQDVGLQTLATTESEDVGTETGPETDSFEMIDQHKVSNDNIIQRFMDARDNGREDRNNTGTDHILNQEPCEVPAEKEEIPLDQRQRLELNIFQVQDGPALDDTEKRLDNKVLGDLESDVHQQHLSLYSDPESGDVTQGAFVENAEDEMLLNAKPVCPAVDRKDEPSEGRKETEDFKETELAEHLINVNIQDNSSQLNLQTQNPEQNRALTEEKRETYLDIILEELQDTERAENVFTAIDSGLSFEDVVTVDSRESHTECEQSENISETSDSQKEEIQAQLNPLVHRRKMGSTRRPLRGNKEQIKYKEHHDESETPTSDSLNSEEKKQKRDTSEENEAGPVKMMDSVLIQSSCSSDLVPEESIAERISDVTEPQTLMKLHEESQENAGDAKSGPVGGDTETHLETKNIKVFDNSIITEGGTEENICDVDVLARQDEFVGDTVTVENNVTSESDVLQNKTSPDTNQEALTTSENVENVSAVTDSGLLVQDLCIVDSEKTDTEQIKIIDHNIIQTVMDVRDNEEDETTETVRRSVQELCDDAADKEKWQEEMTSEPEQRPSQTISQTQDNPPQVESYKILESEREDREEKDEETDNTSTNDQAMKSEEILNPEDISSSETVTSHTHQQLFIQATHEDFIQRDEDVYEESKEEEMFPGADTEHAAFDRRNETKETENFKETETAEHLTDVNIQYNDRQSDLQTQNPEQNKALTEEENETFLDTILEELQETERAENVFTAIDSGLSFEDVVTVDSRESHTECEQSENISETSEDSQKEEIQAQLNPLVHRRKMGSTRRPLRGNKEQIKDKEHHDESETPTSDSLISEEKKQKRDTSEENEAGPVKMMDSVLIQSSCSSDLVPEESIAERICDVTEPQTLMKLHEESQENAGDAKSGPVGGDTETHLETKNINVCDNSTITEGGTEENICDVDVLARQDKFVGDTVTVENNVTSESDVLQNKTSPDTNQEALTTSENVENVSAVTDSGLLVQDLYIVDSEKTDTEQNKIIDRNIIQTVMDVRDNEEDETTETVRRSVQELCDDAADKEKWQEEMTSEPEQRPSQTISQTQDNPPQVKSYKILESEREDREEKDEETDNTSTNDQAMKSEEILNPEDISSSETVTSHTHQQLFIQATHEDFIQRDEDVHEESKEGEMFTGEDTEHTAFDRRNETEETEDFKETETAEHLTDVNIQYNDRQSDLQTQNPEQNRALTEEERETYLDIILEELQETERAENVSNATDSGLSFEDVVTVDSRESHTECEQSENISETSEDSQKEEIQAQLNPLVHRRKMGSTRRPLRGNKEQIKDKEHHDESETPTSDSLNSEEKKQKRDTSEENEAGPVEMMDSVLIQSSCSSDLVPEESIAERISDVTEPQTLMKLHEESQENAGDAKSGPVGGDTETHLETKNIKVLDNSTITEGGTEENICDVDVLTRQDEFVGDTVTVENNMSSESDVLQNKTSPDRNQEALKTSENVENVSAVIDAGLVLQDIVIVSSEDTDIVPEEPEISIIPEAFEGEDSQTKLNPIVHKRKMGSTRRPFRGNKEKDNFKNKDKDCDGKAKEEETEQPSETHKHKNVEEHGESDTIQKMMRVRHNEEEKTPDRVGIAELENLPEVQEETSEFIKDSSVCASDSDLVLSDAVCMGETQMNVSSEPVVKADSPQTENGIIHAVSSRSLQKRKMGSTRKTQRGKRVENERQVGEDKDGETENTPVDDGTTKTEEKFTVEEAFSLIITGTHVDQQQLSVLPAEEGHDIQGNGSKTEEQTENPEASEELVKEQTDPNSNTNPEPFKESGGDNVTAEVASDLHLGDVETNTVPYHGEIIVSHKEEVQSNLYPAAQKRKMGSTRKTHGRKRREVQSEETNGDVKGAEEQPKHSANSEGEREGKFDEDTKFREEPGEEVDRSFDRTTHPAATSKTFSEPENAGNEVSINIPDLSEENLINSQSNRVPTEPFGVADLKSEMLAIATDLKGDEKDYHDNSESSRSTETEKLDTCRRSLKEDDDSHALQICDNQLTVLDQSNQAMHSDVTKHTQSETVTTEKKRKMGSTRKNFRGKREEKREESDSTEPLSSHVQIQFTLKEDQESEINILGEAEHEKITHDSLNQSESSLLSEIERVLNKTSQSPDHQLIISEPNSGALLNIPVETSHLNTLENSEPEHNSDKDKYVSLQVTESQRSKSPSELNSPGRRRKMGSTRKNPRQQLNAERDVEDEDDEVAEEELNVLKKDLETAEESKMHNITDNKENKEYLDVPIALTSGCLLEENANQVAPEGTSPSTKRKFGSRRTNKNNRGFGGLISSECSNELEEGETKPNSSEVQVRDQPMFQPISQYRNTDVRNEGPLKSASLDTDVTQQKNRGAGLVSLDQNIRPQQQDKGSGRRQAADLKSRSEQDVDLVQFNVVMVGNSCVGKTSFINRFHGGQFSPDYCSTIGVDTCTQTVVLEDRVVKLQIWDTAGQERFHSITTQVFHRADGLLLMYDITSSKSFMSVRDWISQVQEKAPDDVIMMLLGNKNDCVDRKVQVQEGDALAREYKINFMECSAATGDNVSECMSSLAELLVQRKRQKMEKHTVLKKEQQKMKSGCC